MRRRTALFVGAVAAALALAPAAGAKGPFVVEICGADECRTFPDRTHWRLVTGVLDVYGSFRFASSSPPTRYYELSVKGAGIDEWLGKDRRVYFVPSRGVVRSSASWIRPKPATLRSLRAAVRGLRPWPRPRVTRAVVAGRTADPSPYAALLEMLPTAEPQPGLGEAVEIRLFFGRPTPWTTTRRPIRYFPSQGIVHRDTQWLRPSRELARRIEADAGLAPPPSPPPPRKGSARASLVAAAVAATLAALAAGGVAVRRARRPRPASA